ncbi:GSCFA domain-containing protein [Methylocystis sp. JAN1]|uniref:GSCFA domain-containing protein n=1 Tax=Methylocystis sp. JAN1 TaxID=3397211 RepID=UPI003FA1B3C0
MIGNGQRPEDVFTKARANAARVFSAHAHDGTSGAERIADDVLERLQHEPKFRLERNAPFFTIGSCFARNIEAALLKHSVECITSRAIFPDELYETTGLGARNGALNAYTPGSMRDLVRFSARQDAETVATLDVGNGEWADLLASGLRFLTRSELAGVRKTLIDAYRRLPEARTVILTLGFTEAWRDLSSGLYVNRPPAGNIRLNRRASGFEFVNMSAAQSLEAVDQTVREIRSQTHDQAKIILTVSPVPLSSTFTREDVITCNDFSKATLLAVAREVASKYDYVDYFPSYQYVRHSNPATTWQDDGVHVQYAVVSRIMEKFADHYL